MSRIKVVSAGSVEPGQYITQADTDDYPVGQYVDPEEYDAAEQDWQHVVKVGGHADVGYFILAHYNGEQYRASGDWTQTVWLNVDDEGEPVHQDPAERD